MSDLISLFLIKSFLLLLLLNIEWFTHYYSECTSDIIVQILINLQQWNTLKSKTKYDKFRFITSVLFNTVGNWVNYKFISDQNLKSGLIFINYIYWNLYFKNHKIILIIFFVNLVFYSYFFKMYVHTCLNIWQDYL